MKYGSNIKIDLKIDVHISDQFAKSNNQKHLNCLNMKHLFRVTYLTTKTGRCVSYNKLHKCCIYVFSCYIPCKHDVIHMHTMHSLRVDNQC